MMRTKPIQVFEYDHLKINGHGFNEQHWRDLGDYNEQHGGNFFHLTPRGVKFHQYVGVIQVGNLTIEVLPKIGKASSEDDKAKWQSVLIDMLRECRWMRVYQNEKASLRFKPNSILEAYLELFVQECETIIREGLVKKYRHVKKNCTALKGKLLFHKQIQVNLVHQERFFTQHQAFDRENLYNQILLKALKLIPVISRSPFLKDRVYNLLLSFPELEDIQVNEATFENIIYNRKTLRYKEAIEIAAMLLLNYRPDISAGRNHVLAILFDMNKLWEEYIYRQLIKNNRQGWTISPQRQKSFWRLDTSRYYKIIKPDIVIKNNGTTVILDTKWKLPDNNKPDDGDLKQMFVYNEYWEGINAILVYPKASFTEKPFYIGGTFAKDEGTDNQKNCGIMKISVLDEANSFLDEKIGKRINDYLREKVFV